MRNILGLYEVEFLARLQVQPDSRATHNPKNNLEGDGHPTDGERCMCVLCVRVHGGRGWCLVILQLEQNIDAQSAYFSGWLRLVKSERLGHPLRQNACWTCGSSWWFEPPCLVLTVVPEAATDALLSIYGEWKALYGAPRVATI